MLISKKPLILLNSLQGFQAASGSWTSSSTRHRTRHYATITGDQGAHNAQEPEHHVWPKPLEGQSCPTPYQIFAMKHNASYSKARFYELVKLYHPDMSNTTTNGVGHRDKLERYRLIVAAHTILSDPTKRSAYDRFGAGWNGRAEVGARDASSRSAPGPFSHSWSDPSDPIWQNATWEDWERFHAWRKHKESGTAEGVAREHQSPLYMQNSYFIALVMLVALMGGSANYNRAQDAGHYFVEQRDLVHDRAAKELRKVRQEMSGLKGRDERIQWFLRQREATMGQMAGNDIEAMREERAARMLRDGEVCRSDGVSGKEV